MLIKVWKDHVLVDVGLGDIEVPIWSVQLHFSFFFFCITSLKTLSARELLLYIIAHFVKLLLIDYAYMIVFLFFKVIKNKSIFLGSP